MQYHLVYLNFLLHVSFSGNPKHVLSYLTACIGRFCMKMTDTSESYVVIAGHIIKKAFGIVIMAGWGV